MKPQHPLAALRHLALSCFVTWPHYTSTSLLLATNLRDCRRIAYWLLPVRAHRESQIQTCRFHRHGALLSSTMPTTTRRQQQQRADEGSASKPPSLKSVAASATTPSKRTRRSLVTPQLSSQHASYVEDEAKTMSEEAEVVTPSSSDSMQTPKKRKTSTKVNSTSRKSAVVSPEPGSKEPPKGWREIYTLVEELRQDRSAPVDGNGSEALPERHRGDKVFRFQVLICLMLSSQTKDGVVGDTIRALQTHGLDVDTISAMSAEQLNSLIGKVGFHNNKTKYIKQVVEILKSDYDSDIPPNAQDMMKLPGVGPKMAFIVESVAWNATTGIGVDTHMHRMFNELRWVSSKNPEQTRIQLESWLPRDHWPTVNLLWVGFGQEIQQFKPKMLRKAIDCSRPAEALRLLRRLGLDYNKEAEKLGIGDEISQVLRKDSNTEL